MLIKEMGMKVKCTAYRLADGLVCNSPAKYEVRFDDRYIGCVCGVHKRAYTDKALFILATTNKEAQEEK